MKKIPKNAGETQRALAGVHRCSRGAKVSPADSKTVQPLLRRGWLHSKTQSMSIGADHRDRLPSRWPWHYRLGGGVGRAVVATEAHRRPRARALLAFRFGQKR